MEHRWNVWLLGAMAAGALPMALAAPTQAWDPIAPNPNADATESSMPPTVQRQAYDRYLQVIERTQAMVNDPIARRLAESLNLNVLNVTWEDTGRFYGSSVGPNISDMTIQVQHQDPVSRQHQLHLMPVIRHPNFEDISADIPLDSFFLQVGNEKGEDLRRVALSEVLGDLRSYLNTPDSWSGRGRSLLAPRRDSHVLVSAQACFLPIPQEGLATFNPVLFNYQSRPGDPAVLTILATREGTSVTVIDNQRDGFEAGQTWGQRLFFNKNGERASFTGQRLSDFQTVENPDGRPGEVAEDDTEGLNMVLLIQVPLKQRAPMRLSSPNGMVSMAPMAAAPSMESRGPSNVEAAVIGHGAVEGPFTEIDNLAIERDPDYPIRVTVQFYKATSNGVVSEADMAEIREQIDRVYAEADYVGSLVVDGPSDRPTEHDGPKDEPADWWQRFREYQRNLRNR
ncbi:MULTISPECIES: hypothetical protein [Cyanophyceae]|uniref:hypothetical protein n=2 Tax=Cyanobacteriota TaxID=1117 RepID=UPI001683C775|nr:hypothetical protein [Phormidium sp. FACHB-77]MBD2028560.1 hypothetical protein [Phormidium sp. FACHB-322]MBD2051796.1 hypothetical protein [Leptolyngbya sp. FACHB-60]